MVAFVTMKEIIISVICLYILNPRFGILGIWFPGFASFLQDRRFYFSYPFMILMFPVNIFVGAPLLAFKVPLSWFYMQVREIISQRKTLTRARVPLRKFETYCKLKVSIDTLFTVLTFRHILDGLINFSIIPYELINYSQYQSNLSPKDISLLVALVLLIPMCVILLLKFGQLFPSV